VRVDRGLDRTIIAPELAEMIARIRGYYDAAVSVESRAVLADALNALTRADHLLVGRDHGPPILRVDR
jgi:hypothetical protein